jgi:uncharacterized membrane protein
MKRMIIFLMVSFFVLSFSGPLFADDNSLGKPSVGDVLGDVLVIRPVGFIEIAFNSLFFVFSLPVTIPLKETKYAEEWLIKDTYNFYFNRGLGEPLGGM